MCFKCSPVKSLKKTGGGMPGRQWILLAASLNIFRMTTQTFHAPTSLTEIYNLEKLSHGNGNFKQARSGTGLAEEGHRQGME
jgi:hypothetical protein